MNDGIFASKVDQQEKIAHVAVITGEIFLPHPDAEEVLHVESLLEFGIDKVQVDVFFCFEISSSLIPIPVSISRIKT